MRVLETELSTPERPYNAIQHRIRCNGHIINLAVQAFLFVKDDEAVELAIEASQQLIQHEEDYITPDEEVRIKWRRMGPLGKLHNISTFIRG